MANLKFDSTDRRLLAAFDSSVIIDDNNESATIADCKIKIVRPEADKLELTIEFAELEYPILVLRTITMERLNITDESEQVVSTMRKIERELRREFPFAVVEITAGNHYRLKLPNGRSVIVAATPSDRRFLRNVRANIRRGMLIKDECLKENR